ncbi:MAG: hypothetical protein QM564_02365 [Bergeyella sp.]
MMYIIFSTIFLLPVLAGIGKISERFAGEILGGISSLIIIGTVAVAAVWAVLSFFLPLNLYMETATLVIGLSSFFYFRLYLNFYDFFLNNSKIFFSSMLAIVVAGSFYPFILDHFGYYVPTIKWLSEAGLVKGIANLDILLGQMSLWHILQAGFSNFSDPFLRLNTIFLIIYLIYICEKKSWLHLLFVPFLFLFSQSPSPDLPVIMFSVIVLDEVLSKNQNISALFLVSAFVFAIKPTMMWLPLLVVLYGFFVMKSRVKFLFSGSLMLLLFVFKNLWCFGFPVFPMQFADVGIPWKPNPELMKISAKVSIEKTYDMKFHYEEIRNFTTWEYISNWLFLKGIKSKIHWLFVLSLAGFSVFTFIKKNRLITFIFISILIKSIIVLAFSAQYRFFIDVFFVVVFVMLYQKISLKTAFSGFAVLSVFFIGFLSFPNLVRKTVPSFKLGQFMLGFQKSQWLEPAYFKLNLFETYQVGNLKFNVVKDYPFSFDTPIPAITPEFLKEDLEAGVFPQQNSDNPKDGFYWRAITEKEKQQLSAIIIKTEEDFKNRKPSK